MGTIALSNFIFAIAQVLHYALQIYMYIVIARALLSWVNPDPYNPIVRFLYNITEPLLGYLRRRLPIVLAGGIDLSPIIIILAILLIDSFIVTTIMDFAYALKHH
jgi:YggT family protein